MEDVNNRILQLKKAILLEKHYKIELYIDNYFMDFPNSSFLKAKEYAYKKAQKNINIYQNKINELNYILDQEKIRITQRNNTNLNQFINIA